jgi:hypothetical protein
LIIIYSTPKGTLCLLSPGVIATIIPYTFGYLAWITALLPNNGGDLLASFNPAFEEKPVCGG